SQSQPCQSRASLPLPLQSEIEEVYADYAALGLSLRNHPLSFCRAELDRLGVTPAAQLAALADERQLGTACRANPDGLRRKDNQGNSRHTVSPGRQNLPSRPRAVRVAGLVILRQRPSTANGITFVTLEDETGTANLIVHQRTWERFYT